MENLSVSFSLKAYKGAEPFPKGFSLFLWLKRGLRNIRWFLLKKRLYPKKWLLKSYVATLEKVYQCVQLKHPSLKLVTERFHLIKQNQKYLKELKIKHLPFLKKEQKIFKKITHVKNFLRETTTTPEMKRRKKLQKIFKNKWEGYSNEEKNLFTEKLVKLKKKNLSFATKISRKKNQLKHSLILTREGDIYPCMHKRDLSGKKVHSFEQIQIASGAFKKVKKLGKNKVLLAPHFQDGLKETLKNYEHGSKIFASFRNKRGVQPLFLVRWGEKVGFLSSQCTGDLEELSDSLPFLIKLKALTDVAFGLASFHEKHLFHGDLKGGNILINLDSNHLKFLRKTSLHSLKGLKALHANQTQGFLADYETSISMKGSVYRGNLPNFTEKFRPILFSDLTRNIFSPEELRKADIIGFGKLLLTYLEFGSLDPTNNYEKVHASKETDLISFSTKWNQKSPLCKIIKRCLEPRTSTSMQKIAMRLEKLIQLKDATA